MVSRRTYNYDKGFTLIELMLATSLLMIVLFSGYYAYSLYTQKWQKRVEMFWNGTQHAIAVDTLHKLLTGAVPYIIKNEDNKAQVYFVGNETELEFVTHSGVFSNSTSLINLSIVPQGNTRLLVYKEKSLTHFTVLNSKQLENKAQEFWDVQSVLVSLLDDMSFSYYGWQSFNDAALFTNVDSGLEERNPPEQEWYKEHNANIMRVLPDNIRVQLSHNQKLTDVVVTLPAHSIYTLLASIRKDLD